MQPSIGVARDGDLLAFDGSDLALTGSEVVDRGRCPLGGIRSPTNRLATLTFSVTKSLAEASGFILLGSNSSVQGFSRPRIWSLMTTPATVPPVMPHLLNPVAT